MQEKGQCKAVSRDTPGLALQLLYYQGLDTSLRSRAAYGAKSFSWPLITRVKLVAKQAVTQSSHPSPSPLHDLLVREPHWLRAGGHSKGHTPRMSHWPPDVQARFLH